MPPALVMTFVRPSATNGSARGEVRGQVARVAARLVALTILLQDRERQLRERFEAEIVDAFGEERVDGGRGVAVEPLAAGDRNRTGNRRSPRCSGDADRRAARSAHGRGGFDLRGEPNSRSSRNGAATSCTPIGRTVVGHVGRHRHRRLTGDVERRGVRRERQRAAPMPAQRIVGSGREVADLRRRLGQRRRQQQVEPSRTTTTPSAAVHRCAAWRCLDVGRAADALPRAPCTST